MEIQDKVVVITGAASGIGAALAQRCATAGAAGIVIADRNLDGARSVADTIGAPALALGCDVSREEAIQALVAAACERFGRVDVYVSNAGILGPQGGIEVADAVWNSMWATPEHSGTCLQKRRAARCSDTTSGFRKAIMKTRIARSMTALALACTTLMAIGDAHAYGLCRAPRQPGCLGMMNFAKDEASIRACRMEVEAYRQQVAAYLRCIADEVAAERAEQIRNADRARQRIDCYEQARSVCF